MRAFLTQLELEAWVKTSGGKGLHVVVPLTPSLDYETVKAFSRAVVQHLAKTLPSRFVAKSGAANRIGKLFVDYLRNGLGSTTASAFSARARPGLGVSMPIAWDDIPNLNGAAHWNIATARDYVTLQTTDPWTAYWGQETNPDRRNEAIGVQAFITRKLNATITDVATAPASTPQLLRRCDRRCKWACASTVAVAQGPGIGGKGSSRVFQ